MLSELIVCFYVVCSLEKDDFLETLHGLSCCVQLKSILCNLLSVLDPISHYVFFTFMFASSLQHLSREYSL